MEEGLSQELQIWNINVSSPSKKHTLSNEANLPKENHI
jgi:hypothetical protein